MDAPKSHRTVVFLVFRSSLLVEKQLFWPRGGKYHHIYRYERRRPWTKRGLRYFGGPAAGGGGGEAGLPGKGMSVLRAPLFPVRSAPPPSPSPPGRGHVFQAPPPPAAPGRAAAPGRPAAPEPAGPGGPPDAPEGGPPGGVQAARVRLTAGAREGREKVLLCGATSGCALLSPAPCASSRPFPALWQE